jgi:hypothetical protein
MDKYKNVLLSSSFFIAAPIWIVLWLSLGRVFIANPIQSHALSSILYAVYIWPYFIFFALGVFFGWKNLKSEKPSVIGNIVTLLGIVALLLSVAYYFWAASWSV